MQFNNVLDRKIRLNELICLIDYSLVFPNCFRMADFATGGTQQQPKGWDALRKHVLQYKIDVALWATRIATLLFTIGYFIPLFW